MEDFTTHPKCHLAWCVVENLQNFPSQFSSPFGLQWVHIDGGDIEQPSLIPSSFNIFCKIGIMIIPTTGDFCYRIMYRKCSASSELLYHNGYEVIT